MIKSIDSLVEIFSKRKILHDAITILLAKSIVIVTLAISVPLSFSYLNADEFGVWLTLSSLTGIIVFLDFGIGNTLINSISEFKIKKDYRSAAQITSIASFLLGFISIFLLCIYAFYSSKINWLSIYGIEDSRNVSEIRLCSDFFVIFLLISLPFTVIQKIQYGYQEIFISNVWQVLGNFISLISVIYAMYNHANLHILIIALMYGPLLSSIVNWVSEVLHRKKWAFPKLSYLNYSTTRNLILNSLIWCWFQIISFVGSASDNLLITYFFGVKNVSTYALMSRLLSFVLIANIFMIPLWTTFSAAIINKDFKKVKNIFIKSIKIAIYCGLIGFIVMVYGSHIIIPIWVQSEIVPSNTMAFGFGVWCLVVHIYGVVASILSISQFFKRLTIVTTLAALGSILLKIVFVPILGIDFIIWATSITYFFACIYGLLFIKNKLLLQESLIH